MLRGFAAVSIECGNHVSENGINVAMEHIERALEYLNALKSQTTTFKNTVSYEGEPRTYEMSDRVAPEEDFAWTKEVYSEMPLKKDEVFAHGKSGDHAAPYECYMIMPAKHPEPTDTDAGFLALKI